MGKAARQARRASGEVKAQKTPTRPYRSRAEEQTSRRNQRKGEELAMGMMPYVMEAARAMHMPRW